MVFKISYEFMISRKKKDVCYDTPIKEHETLYQIGNYAFMNKNF